MKENAGFWRRVLAALIDIIPITLLVASVFYFYYGFDDVLRSYFTQLHDLDARREFIHERNHIRNLSFVIWILYSILLECTAFQATFGKLLVGLKVVDQNGNRLSYLRSIVRNLLKFVSLVPFSLGFIWVAFTKQKQGWHDLVVKAFVIKK